MLNIVMQAEGEIGYIEKASNSQLDNQTANAGSANYTKYGAWYGMNPAAWCDIFVSWCAYKTGCLDAVGKYAYCPYHVQFFKDNGQYFARGAKTPQEGDIIFFTANGTTAAHVGIVCSVSSTKVTTIEGNTSNSAILVTNGGCVAKKSYSLTSTYILGYGRPQYNSTTTTENGGFVEMAGTYKNGSTVEPVYADSALKTKIGELNKYETCTKLGTQDGKTIVLYQVDDSSYHKIGFVEYAGS